MKIITFATYSCLSRLLFEIIDDIDSDDGGDDNDNDNDNDNDDDESLMMVMMKLLAIKMIDRGRVRGLQTVSTYLFDNKRKLIN